jgi:hypothetical protein
MNPPGCVHHLADLPSAFRLFRPKYAPLFQSRRFDSTITMEEADRRRRSCQASAVYVHYCRRAAIEPYVISAGAARSCLEQAHSFSAAEWWTCVYVGEVAISAAGRVAATRFYYEFAGGGHLKQASALESLCSLLYRGNKWTPYHTNSGGSLSTLRIYLLPHHREEFLAWRRQNVRVAWREFPDSLDSAKQRVRFAEAHLISGLAPLLNIRHGTNDFKPTLRQLKTALRSDSRKLFHPKP